MKRAFNIILILVFALKPNLNYGYNEPLSGTVYLDKGAFHQAVNRLEQSVTANTYFMIAAETLLSANTGASAIINAYADMRAISKSTPIYFVLNNNGGIAASEIGWYFKNVYKVDLEQDANVHLITNDSLYHYLHFGGPISKMFYVYNGFLMYKENAKLHFISEAKLPHHHFNVQQNRRVELKGDSIKFSYMDIFQLLSENKMLCLTDIQNKLVMISLDNGTITSKYTPESGVACYCDLIAKTQAECDTAKKYIKTLDDLNRKSYYIFNYTYDNRNIYLSVGLQVPIKMKKELSFRNDENKTEKIKEGELFAYGFQTLGILDTNLIAKKHFYLPENITPDKDIVPSIDFGFHVINDGRSIISVPGQMQERYPKSFKPLLMQMAITDTACVFDKYLKPEMTKSYKKMATANLYNHFCEFNGDILCLPDNGKEIYSTNNEKPISQLTGDGTPMIKTVIPKYTEESKNMKLNFVPLSMSADSNYLYVAYRFKDKYLLEIKDKTYKTVDIVDLSSIKEIERLPKDDSRDNIKTYKNKLYIKYLDKNAHYISIYDIVHG